MTTMKFVLAVATLLARQAHGKEALVTLYNDQVAGMIVFSQDGEDDPVTVSLNLTGLDGEAGGYHVHQLPVNNGGSGLVLSSAGDFCGGDITGGHFDPLQVNTNPATYDCSDAESCEAGDLSGRFGSLVNLTDIDETFVDVAGTGLTLFGANSILGRSVVVHKTSGERWVCGTILEKDVQYKRVVATFDGATNSRDAARVLGTVTFLQNADDSSAETIIFSNLRQESGASREFEWSVHESRINYVVGCDSAEEEFKDLSAVHGNIPTGKYIFSDSSLPLSGQESISGRSVVLLNGGARVSCADLGRSAVAVLPVGKVTFFQAAEDDPVLIDVAFQNLGGLAGGYHVHTLPILTSDSCASTGGHYNPLNVVGGSGNEAAGEYQCTQDSPELCEAGDISGKFGALTGLETFSAQLNSTDSGLQLFGENSILGRSVVVHKNGTGERWFCAEINQIFEKEIVQVRFDTDEVTGTIKLSQTVVDPDAETTVVVNVTGTGVSHAWHVHESSVPEGETCAAALGHYNPHKVIGGAGEEGTYMCPPNCEAGDLAGKHGVLSLPAKGVFTDASLPVNWIEERSIVIHADGSGARLACGNVDVLQSGEQTSPPVTPGESAAGVSAGVVVAIVLIVVFMIVFAVVLPSLKPSTEAEIKEAEGNSFVELNGKMPSFAEDALDELAAEDAAAAEAGKMDAEFEDKDDAEEDVVKEGVEDVEEDIGGDVESSKEETEKAEDGQTVNK